MLINYKIEKKHAVAHLNLSTASCECIRYHVCFKLII